MTTATVQSRILTSWRAIELFSAQSVPSPAPKDTTKPVFRVLGSEPLPWQIHHPLQQRRLHAKQTWRHTIYAGLFTSTMVNDLLEQQFGANTDTFDSSADRAFCLFAFGVDNNGRPLADTFALSSLAWALGRTLDPGPGSPDWLTGFFEAEETARQDFEHRYALRGNDQTPDNHHEKYTEADLLIDESANRLSQRAEEHDIDASDKSTKPLDHGDLIAEVNQCIASFGLADHIEKPMCRVSSSPVSDNKNDVNNEPVLLNSLFVDDLHRVANDVRTHEPGKALDEYLTAPESLDIGNRVDVKAQPDTVFKTLAPAYFPSARWPSPNGHSLVTSQQFAVNSVVCSMRNSTGISAVNGPPGTGKTTLLRDLIANIVVDRALQLAKLDSPEDAFSGFNGWKAGEYQRTIWHWEEAFHGHEIIVASSNNGAVENVTMEIPEMGAIDASALDGIDHFQELATHILGNDKQAWGLMAAKLGKRENRSAFRSRFWFDRDADEEGQPKRPGMNTLLKNFSQMAEDWPAAVAAFKATVSLSEQHQKERQHLYEQGARLRKLSEEITTCLAKSNETEARVFDLESLLEQAIHEETKSRNTLEASRKERLNHRHFRPGLIEIFFTVGRTFRKWRAKDEQLEAVTDADENVLTAATDVRTRLASELSHEQHSFQVSNERLTELNNEQSGLAAQHSSLAQALGLDIPTPDSKNWRNDTKRELSSPWVDDSWNEARSQVFISALALHRSFLRANASRMRQSLLGAMDVLEGKVPDDATTETVMDAWRALFFIVPVVSTTFSSFARLFPQLGKESLGWLLVDEAGQALPQEAVGALWRARRAVIVGDPLQLEPIVSISLKAQEALRQYHDVNEIWMPGFTSVQRLADRVSPFGTCIDSGIETVWVGLPLRVHRRCDTPMFSISNAIAYDGLMVNGFVANEKRSRLMAAWPCSRWFDVRSPTADGNWVEAEGEVTVDLLEQLISLGADPGQIFLISPFRPVADRLRTLTRRFKNIRSGTVHTTQGKEADIVVLVLGSDPARPGARQWAASKPNLLNVAVSRAKHRLYVIGDLSAWRQCNYFSTCADRLEAHVRSEKPETTER